MENVVVSQSRFWNNKKVFITGHTGFKGGWLSIWLSSLGAKIKGYSLSPNTVPSLFNEADIDAIVDSEINNILDYNKLNSSILDFEPDIIFHLAAQPLVRLSYEIPVETYKTNIIGTVNILDICRHVDSVKGVVVITSDKCYDNLEDGRAYRETDPLGGYDPYSSSKGCAEIVTSAFKKSFFESEQKGIATVRAGNVLGGGDWSEDRLVPDILKSFNANKPVIIRNPNSVRPWQHVLEPLSGYMLLAEKLYNDPSKFSQAWNFGPVSSDICEVSIVLDLMIKEWGSSASWDIQKIENKLHEANVLNLNISKSRKELDWTPTWDLNIAISMTVQWFISWKKGNNMHEESLKQINKFQKDKVGFN